jgi:hypothetical protein
MHRTSSYIPRDLSRGSDCMYVYDDTLCRFWCESNIPDTVLVLAPMQKDPLIL